MNIKAVKDAYPLSPLQQGMLFHHLCARHSGVDIQQIICTLHEDLQIAALDQAWQRVIAHHPVLRTSFLWEGLDEPLQQVHDLITVPLQQQDLRSLSSDEQQKFLQDYLQTDRSRGFDLAEAPLMRLALFRAGMADYRLVWSFHHILMDGRSFPLILKEVFSLYEMIRQGRDLELPHTRPYQDYITWLHAQDWSKAEEFWRRSLKGYTTPVVLNVQTTAPSLAQEANYGRQQTSLSATLTATLKSLADAHGLTLNTITQGAWALLLSRYSGQQDVVFGATRACRHSALDGTEDMAGLLINTLPVRVQASPEALLIPWLQELRAQQITVRDYEHTPLAEIQRWSELPHGTQLFGSLLVFENYQLNARLQALGGEWKHREVHYFGQTNYPLTVLCYAGQELLIQIEYDCRLFDAATVTRMLGHYQTLLEGMALNSAGCIKDIPLLTGVERAQVLSWNQGQSAFPCKDTLPALFEAQVVRNPEGLALSYEGATLNYAELNRRANQLAHHLRHMGVGPEILVGLCVQRSLGMVIGILAILKAGGAYVPLDPAYPQERLTFMLEDAGLAVLVTEQCLLARLPACAAQLVCLDTEQELLAAQPDTNPESLAQPDHAAYVIYTSGSTGTPKGVLITQANVTRLMAATEAWFGFNSTDVWTLFHSYAFDFSVWEIWGALLYGGRLVIVPYNVSRAPDAFYELLYQERVTVLNQTPSAFRQLMQAEERVGMKALTLRYVIFGGEALELYSLKPWFERHGEHSPQLINMYGITETTVHVTYRPITLADVSAGSGSVIGQVIPDLQLYLLDLQRQPVPIGLPGEIYVGGAGLAHGYLNRPELSAERFIAHPFSNDPKARLYRSGDLARYLPNGDIEYLGRCDQQVKIRGFRIELGEIEAQLVQHHLVREAVVTVRDDSPGDKRLVAYLVAAAHETPDSLSLRNFLKAQLPEYMVPAAFVVLERLPLTAHGKVDIRALPIPDPGVQTRSETNYVAPQGNLEQNIAKVWREIFHLEKVGIHDNFFDLGGHSMLMVSAHEKLKKIVADDFSIIKLFQYPTISSLAKYLGLKQVVGSTADKISDRARRQKQAIISQRKRAKERSGEWHGA